jgi:hypothetical protein
MTAAGTDSFLPLSPPQVIQAFVRQAMGYIEQTPDKHTKISLIKTLQTVTEGKVGSGSRTCSSSM